MSKDERTDAHRRDVRILIEQAAEAARLRLVVTRLESLLATYAALRRRAP